MAKNHKAISSPKKFKQFLKKMGSLPGAITIIGLITIWSLLAALSSISGTETTVFSGLLFKGVKDFLGLQHPFSSTWFYLIVLMLGVNLSICLFGRLKRLIRQPNAVTLGSWLLHLGIILVLVGGIKTSTSRSEQVYSVIPGHTVSLAGFGQPLSLRVNSFTVNFSDLTPQQYITRVTPIEKGKELEEETIAVNHPLSWKGIKTYQTGYGWVINGELGTEKQSHPVVINSGSMLELSSKPYLALKADFLPDYLLSVPGQEATNSEYPRKPRIAFHVYSNRSLLQEGILAPGQSIDIQGYWFRFRGYQRYTVLHTKVDPGLPWVNSGFALLVTGMVLRYLLNRWKPTGGWS